MEIKTLSANEGDVVFVSIISGNNILIPATSYMEDIRIDLSKLTKTTGVHFCLVPNLDDVRSVEITKVMFYKDEDKEII